MGYIERNEVRPVVSKTDPLAEIAQAQQDFLTGTLVLIPPSVAPVTPTLDTTETKAAQ
jgi:hypothetical protein